MGEIPRTGVAKSARTDTFVVLFAPSAAGDIDFDALLVTLRSASHRIRVLMHVTKTAELTFAATFENAQIETQWLLPSDILPPDGASRYVQMPQDSSCEEREDLALALADAVVTPPTPESGLPAPSVRLLSEAAKLGKLPVEPGKTLNFLSSSPSVTRHLDPETGRLNTFGKRVFGRLEQLFLEGLAMEWRPWHAEGLIQSCKDILKPCALKWPNGPYFARPGWEKDLPDSAARVPEAPIWIGFETLDRSAHYGSFVHRDLVWVVHLAAAFAVFSAVAGELWTPPGQAHGWPTAELVALLIVVCLIVWAQWSQLQDRWIACRLGAEQIRIARMCLPLLVIPPALNSIDKQAVPPDASDNRSWLRKVISFRSWRKGPDYMLLALMEVKRVVREQGLPMLCKDVSVFDWAEWLKLIVDDQLVYHERNHRKLERAEKKLLAFTTFLFLCAIVSVITHFRHEWRWLLLFTASGPAFAAAVHGAGTRLGIVHRNALSEAAVKELMPIQTQLGELIRSSSKSDQTWQHLRALALKAADAMGRENTSWHGLVRRERDEFPV